MATLFSAHFEKGLELKFCTVVMGLWNNEARLRVNVHKNFDEYKTPNDFDPRAPITDTLEQMAEVFYNRRGDYHELAFSVKVDRTLNESTRDDEVENIFSFIQTLRSSDFRPLSLSISYLASNPNFLDRLVGNIWNDIRIHDWQNIDEEQIMELLKG